MNKITRELRTQASYAEEVLKKIVPENNLRHDLILHLKETWEYTSTLYPQKSKISLFNNKIRLNVGMIEVFVITKKLVGISIDKTLLTEYSNKKTNYKTVPDAYFILQEIQSFLKDYSTIHHAHLSIINKAAKTRKHPMADISHSTGLVAYLEAYNAINEMQKENIMTLEGRTILSLHKEYKRSLPVKEQCIQYHGTHCSICGFDFEKQYGEIGKGFIEVHHITPLSSIATETPINPIEDLIPVCVNCHRMLHRKKDTVLLPDELKNKIKDNFNN